MTVTGLSTEYGFPEKQVKSCEEEMKNVTACYDFSSTHHLCLPTTRLDTMPIGDLIDKVGKVFQQMKLEILYLPYRGDVHTDHQIVHDVAIACTKWFRYSFVNRVLCYEALSETEFNINPDTNGFPPNVFIDVSAYIEEKLSIMCIFKGEIGPFPFPRSEKALQSLAEFRGASSGYEAAEAFMLLRERY